MQSQTRIILEECYFLGLCLELGRRNCSFMNFIQFRVVAPTDSETNISGQAFKNYGSHIDNYRHAYLNASATIGLTKEEIDTFITVNSKNLKSH